MATNMAVDSNNVIASPPRRGLFARLNAVKDNLSAMVSEKINKETLATASETLTSATKAVGGFLRDTAVQSADRLRNMTANDWKWAGLSVGAGVAAKVGVFAALGVASGGTVTAALIGGAVVGLTRSAINHVRESQQAQPKSTWKALLGLEKNYTQKDHFLGTKTLMNTASSAAISAATFGILSGAEYVSGVNIAEKLSRGINYGAEKAGAGISRAFNAAVDRVVETQWWKTYAQEQVKGMLAKGFDLSNSLKAGSGKIKFDVQFDTAKHTATAGANQNIDGATREAALAKVRAWEATQVKAPVAAPASATVATPAGLEGRTLEETKFGDDTGMTVPRDMPDVQMPDPTKPVEIEIKTADGETTIIKAQPMPNMSAEYAIAQQALNNEYIADRLRGEVHGLTGKAPNADMSVEEMAKLVVPRNPDTYLRVLAQEAGDKAVKLDPTKMAAACVTDLPQTSEALAQQGNVIPNTCAIAKGMEGMAEGDYVLVRDAAEQAPSTKRGIRALFKQAIDGATAQVKEKTASFIDKVVAGYEIPDMTQQKIGELAVASAEQTQLLAMAPNP